MVTSLARQVGRWPRRRARNRERPPSSPAPPAEVRAAPRGRPARLPPRSCGAETGRDGVWTGPEQPRVPENQSHSETVDRRQPDGSWTENGKSFSMGLMCDVVCANGHVFRRWNRSPPPPSPSSRLNQHSPNSHS